MSTKAKRSSMQATTDHSITHLRKIHQNTHPHPLPNKSSSKYQPPLNMFKQLHKMSSSGFKAERSMMRPSMMMNMEDSNDDYYVCEKDDRKELMQMVKSQVMIEKKGSTNHRRRSHARKRSIIMIDQDENNQFIELTKLITQGRQHNKKHSSGQQEIRQETSRKIQISFPRSTITSNFYFQISQNQDTNHQDKQEITPSYKQQTHNASLIPENKNESIIDGLNTQQKQQQMAIQMQGEQKEQVFTDVDIDIMQSNPLIKEKSKYFEEIIWANNTKRIEELMLQPIKVQSKLIFQVIVNQTIVDKSFVFNMIINGQKYGLLIARKFLFLSQTIYQIQYASNSTTKNSKTIAKMVSNFDRNQYNIYSQEEGDKPSFIYGTILSTVNVYHPKHLTLYYSQHPHQIHSFNKNMQDIHREADQASTIKHICTTKLKFLQKSKVMRQQGLRKSSKSMEFKGEKDDIKLIIGKKCSKTYKLICGSGLSPLQCLALAIVNIQI